MRGLHSRVLMLGTVVTAVAFTVWQAARTSYIHLNGGCGDDGGRYCEMARGISVARPFKNRLLGPLVVRAGSFTGISLPDRFLILDIVFAIVAMACVWLLVRKVAAELGADPGRASQFGVVGAALLLLNPWMAHFIVSNPSMSDIIGLGLGLVWIYLYRNSPSWWVAAPVALAAVLAREAWFIPVLVIAAVDWRLWSRSVPRAVANAGAAVLAYAIVTVAPYAEAAGHEYSTLGAFKQWFKANFASVLTEGNTQQSGGGLVMLAWFFVFGLGLVPLLVLCGRRAELRRSTWASTLVVLALTHLVLAFFGGGDTDRLFMPTATLLTVVGLAVVAANPRFDLLAGALALATIVEWRPWQIVSPVVRDIKGATVATGFWSFWGARDLSTGALADRMAADAAMLALPLALVVVAAVMVRRRPEAAVAAASEAPARA